MNTNYFYEFTHWAVLNRGVFWPKLLMTIVILMILHFAIWGIAKLLQQRLMKRQSIWLQALFYAIRRPTGVFIWVAGLIYSLFIVDHSPFYAVSLQLVEVVFIVTLVWLVLRMLSFAEKRYSDEHYSKSKQQRDSVYTIGRFAKVVTVIIGVIIVLQSMGVSVAGLIAFGGIGAAGIAFSAKDILGNFFGGLMVFFNRPFSVGDWIRSPDRNIEGTVEHIGWLFTRIRTFEKCPLYVPNGIFSNIAIENPQRMLNRRIKQIIGVRYDDANRIDEITEAIKAMLKAHPEIDQHQTIIVDLVNFGQSSLDIMLYTFTKTTDWVKFQDIQQDVFLKIIAIIGRFDAECAFPTTTLHVANNQMLTDG